MDLMTIKEASARKESERPEHLPLTKRVEVKVEESGRVLRVRGETTILLGHPPEKVTEPHVAKREKAKAEDLRRSRLPVNLHLSDKLTEVEVLAETATDQCVMRSSKRVHVTRDEIAKKCTYACAAFIGVLVVAEMEANVFSDTETAIIERHQPHHGTARMVLTSHWKHRRR